MRAGGTRSPRDGSGWRAGAGRRSRAGGSATSGAGGGCQAVAPGRVGGDAGRARCTGRAGRQGSGWRARRRARPGRRGAGRGPWSGSHWRVAFEKTTSKTGPRLGGPGGDVTDGSSSRRADRGRAADEHLGELSRPVTAAAGQRPRRRAVLLPGPQPRSMTVRDASASIRAARSRQGCVRSSANFRYLWALQSGILPVLPRLPRITWGAPAGSRHGGRPWPAPRRARRRGGVSPALHDAAGK